VQTAEFLQAAVEPLLDALVVFLSLVFRGERIPTVWREALHTPPTL